MALVLAELSFGSGRGLAISAALQRMIEAMALTRRDAFLYKNLHCEGCSAPLTEAERHFVLELRAVRLGQCSATSVHATLLCEANDRAPFLKAAAKVFSIVSGTRWDAETETWLTE